MCFCADNGERTAETGASGPDWAEASADLRSCGAETGERVTAEDIRVAEGGTADGEAEDGAAGAEDGAGALARGNPADAEGGAEALDDGEVPGADERETAGASGGAAGASDGDGVLNGGETGKKKREKRTKAEKKPGSASRPSEADIRLALKSQLSAKGLTAGHYTDMLEDYMSLYRTKKALISDIRSRGTKVMVYMANGTGNLKTNDSVADLLKVNGQMLRILDTLGISAEGGAYLCDDRL